MTAEKRHICATADHGLLVCLEGIDGSGKSTVAPLLAHQLRACGISATAVDRRTPADSGLPGARLRALEQLLWGYPADANLGSLGDRHLIHLLASWFYLFERVCIGPRLEAGEVVVLDTWYHKYVARFAAKEGFAPGEVESLFSTLRAPDITVVLDLPAEQAIRRKISVKRTEADTAGVAGDSRVEQFVVFQSAVRARLLQRATAAGWAVVDAAAGVEEVVNAVARGVVDGYARRRERLSL